MNANERSKRLTLRIPLKSTSTIDKNEDIATTEAEFQEIWYMQQAFKSIKNWNFLQPENEIEWLYITQDFLKTFPNVHPKQKLQLIITFMKYHVEAEKMALIKLHRVIEEKECDPLIQFFQWIAINYKLSERQKTMLIQKAIENKKLNWKDNPATEIEAAIQEVQLTVDEVTKNRFISNLVKEILRNKMPTAYYVQIAEMNIAEMLQKIPEIWKECGFPGTKFQYKKHRAMRDKRAKYHAFHAHDIKKKVRHRVRLCYCCRQAGHQAKNRSWNTSTKTSKRRITGISK